MHWQCEATGRVQGVYYRARVLEAAMRQGLAGAVENRPNGTVLIDVQGPEDSVRAFLRDVTGPLGLSDARSVRRVGSLPIMAGLTEFVIIR